MRTLGNIPPALIDPDSNSGTPPARGLAMVLGGSFLFWATMIWVVLR